jgi:hypothetical protein
MGRSDREVLELADAERADAQRQSSHEPSPLAEDEAGRLTPRR